MPEARIGTSSNVAGSPSLDIQSNLTSALDLANVTRVEMLRYGSAAKSNGFHQDHVEDIGDARIQV